MKAKNSIKPSTVIVGCTIIAAALFAGVLLASNKDIVLPETEVVAENIDCLQVYNTASMIMKLRQGGQELPSMLEMAGDDSMLVTMTKQAYANSQYEIEENQHKATKDFAEKWYLSCEEVNKK